MNIIFKTLRYLIKKRNHIKNITLIALLITTIVFSILTINYEKSYNKSKATNQTLNETLSEYQVEVFDLETQVTEYETLLEESKTNIETLQKEVSELKDTATKLTAVKNGTFKADGNYNQAQIVWDALKDLGLNDYVCAGIMGNIMREVAGDALDISRWPVYSQTVYYGICQWAGSRKERLLKDFGTTLNDQIRFLSVELFEVIPKGSSFYDMQNEKDTALYFAKYYERCSTKGYVKRQNNATKALEYFT
jgi:competence protein ComGC